MNSMSELSTFACSPSVLKLCRSMWECQLEGFPFLTILLEARFIAAALSLAFRYW